MELAASQSTNEVAALHLISMARIAHMGHTYSAACSRTLQAPARCDTDEMTSANGHGWRKAS